MYGLVVLISENGSTNSGKPVGRHQISTAEIIYFAREVLGFNILADFNLFVHYTSKPYTL